MCAYMLLQNTPNENMKTGSHWSNQGHTTSWFCVPTASMEKYILIYILFDFRENTGLFHCW